MKKVLSTFLVSLMLALGFFAYGSTIAADSKGTNKVYLNSTDFLKAEGDICQTATDGCNTQILNDGKLGISTEMYCEDVYGDKGQEKWSCLKYKTFDNKDEFIKAYGDVCMTASDGCNTVTMNEGKLGGMTMMYCEDIYGDKGQEKWSCINFMNYYKTSQELLNAEGDICKAVTDGCNTGPVINGRIGGMTMMYCEDVYGDYGQEKWSCLSYEDNYTPDTEMNVCTKEYMPVCGVDGVTYGNKCMAGKIEIEYNGECKKDIASLSKDTLIYVDQNILNALLKEEAYARTKFKAYTNMELYKMIDNIDNAIETTKLLRITFAAQKERITKYVFLRTVIIHELDSRS